MSKWLERKWYFPTYSAIISIVQLLHLLVPFLLFGKTTHSISKKQGVLEPADRDSNASLAIYCVISVQPLNPSI